MQGVGNGEFDWIFPNKVRVRGFSRRMGSPSHLRTMNARRALDHRGRSRPNFGTVPVPRGIDPLAVDDLLGSLRCRSLGDNMPVPPFGIDGSPRSQVEDRDVPVNAQWQKRQAEQVTDDIVAREP